jgi:peptidoglycan/xylan/chitin deacetylase (PgdA/CDA1 family)
MTAHVLARARPGSIVIMHVMYAGRETSRLALPAIIEGLRAKGFSFATVSGLIAAGQVGAD